MVDHSVSVARNVDAFHKRPPSVVVADDAVMPSAVDTVEPLLDVQVAVGALVDELVAVQHSTDV